MEMRPKIEPRNLEIIDYYGQRKSAGPLDPADSQRLKVEWGGKERVFFLLSKN
jgi:hypothetical protein